MRWPFTRNAAVLDVEPEETSRSSSSRFSFRLFRELCASNATANVFFSPSGVMLCLALVHELASAETRQQMSAALELAALDDAGMSKEIAKLKKAFGARSGGDVSFANALWLNQHVDISFQTQKQLRDLYDSELANIDFSARDAIANINAWVSSRTAGKISSIVNDLSPLAAMAATNAVHFKSRWRVPFEKELTFDGRFLTLSRDSKRIPLMSQTGHYPYYESEKVQIIVLPYKGNASMIVVLPAAGLDGAQFLRSLTSGQFESWLKKLKSSEGFIRLPRFKLDSEVQLVPSLRALGITRAFDPGLAQFEHVHTDRPPVWLNQISHRAVIDVSEEGTEAAAATAMMFECASAMNQKPRRTFKMIVDRPFFLAIRDDTTEAILFMGWIGDPT